MKWPRSRRSPRWIEKAVWVVALSVTVTILGLSVASALTYSSIAVAQHYVYVDVQSHVTFSVSKSDGTPAANSTVAVHVALVAVNPSDRSVTLEQVSYCGWIEDLPAEAGLNTTRASVDAHLSTPNGTNLYFPVACLPTRPVSVAVGAHGNATFPMEYAFNATTPSVFAALRNITSYGVRVLGSADAVPWDHWAQALFVIDGVPPATSPTAGTYILKIHLIFREVGIYLGA